MNKGDRITWTYSQTYYNNARKTQFVKHGEFVRLIKHTKQYHGPRLALILLDNHPGTSKAPLFQLKTEQP